MGPSSACHWARFLISSRESILWASFSVLFLRYTTPCLVQHAVQPVVGFFELSCFVEKCALVSGQVFAEINFCVVAVVADFVLFDCQVVALGVGVFQKFNFCLSCGERDDDDGRATVGISFGSFFESSSDCVLNWIYCVVVNRAEDSMRFQVFLFNTLFDCSIFLRSWLVSLSLWGTSLMITWVFCASVVGNFSVLD